MSNSNTEAKKESWFKRLLRWLAIPRVSINYFHQREAIGIFLQEIGLASKLNLPLADTLDQVRLKDYSNIHNVFRFSLFIILSMFLLFGIFTFVSSTYLGMLLMTILTVLFLVSFSNFPRRGYVRYLSMVVSGDVKKGMSFSKTMERHLGVFEPFEIGMIRCGEEAGDLSGACKKAAEFGQIQAHFARLGNYLIYPMLLLVIAGLLISFIMVSIMPKFEEIYAQLGADMPGLYIIGLCT